VERTVTVLVRAPGGSGRPQGSPGRRSSHPLAGDRVDIAQQLDEFASVGVHHVQLVVDPITVASIEWLGGIL
jgi:hypothetical protein